MLWKVQKKEKHGWRGGEVRDRALPAAVQREEALQRRRERGFRAEVTYVRTSTYIYVCTAAYSWP